MQPMHEYSEMFEAHTEMNRRAINFLTTAKMFVDQLPQRVSTCGTEKDVVSKQLNDQYDATFEYRFMEALRNHVQHSGSAVHGLSFGGGWSVGAEGRKDRMTFAPEVLTERRLLEQDSKFKKSVLSECPERVDLLDASRKYLGQLSVVHNFIRCEIDRCVSNARRIVADAIKRYSEHDSSSVGLTAYAQDESGVERVAVFLDWDEVRVKLAKRNREASTLGQWVVSNRRD
ncbi:MAG: hypothetical protein ACLGI6_09780 [Gammaproteobacteria bacterium]